MSGQVFLGWTSTKQGLMCLTQGHNTVAAGEAQTRNPLVTSQALYHWATVLLVSGLFLKWFHIGPVTGPLSAVLVLKWLVLAQLQVHGQLYWPSSHLVLAQLQVLCQLYW